MRQLFDIGPSRDKILDEYLALAVDRDGIVYPELRKRAAELRKIMQARRGNYRLQINEPEVAA